ncbi:MAG: cysteine--tRNA ligase, partial [Oscillospiraceae bacterium]|nr:cysteine--tRNA ligase [Oscillospiraceae bacterium]
YYVFGEHDAEDLEVGVREGVEADENKKNKADFVLWFTKSKFEDQELKWESPWGYGYPGWHIECSAISLKYCGEYLDIHCGGIDNQFPHHTNEIAQSESYLGHKWCNFWFHVLHLNTASGKMSKSSGKFLTVSVLEEQGIDPLAYRYFCLNSHYRKNLVFSDEALENAATAYKKLRTRSAALKEDGEVNEAALEEFRAKFREALDNDLITSLALTAVYDVLKADENDATKRAIIADYDKVLALDLLKPYPEEKKDDADPEILAKIAERAAAKKAKDYAKADAIRAELAAQGITLIDTPQGTTYKRG